MPSIQSSGYPLVFGVADALHGDPDPVGRISVQTEVRSLEGMQKEALVRVGSGRTWRMVSDEGPYLDGTDLAPFPLAFFAAGMQFSFLSELVRSARAQSVEMASVTLSQDTFYTMEGSFLRGDATGGARAARIEVAIEADAEAERVAGLVRTAEKRSGPQALMRDAMTSVFALTHNGNRCDVAGLAASASGRREAPNFRGAVPDPGGQGPDGIITKIQEAETLHGVAGGAGSSLKAEQKRTLHIHGEVRLGEGMAMETDIRLLKPIGSSFRFWCDESPENGGTERAPSPLAYLGAGVGFCYMTQLGRYAHILKKDLADYSLVQKNEFVLPRGTGESAGSTAAQPFDTHLFMESDETDEVAVDFLRTAAKTCFLHAAMAGKHPSDVRCRLNGAEIAV